MHGTRWDAASSAWENWPMSLQGYSLSCLKVDDDQGSFVMSGKRQTSQPSSRRARRRIQVTTGCQSNFLGRLLGKSCWKPLPRTCRTNRWLARTSMDLRRVSCARCDNWFGGWGKSSGSLILSGWFYWGFWHGLPGALIARLWRCGLNVCMMSGKLTGQMNPKGYNQWYEVQVAAGY